MPEQPTDPAGNPAGNSGGPHYGGPYDRNGSPFFDGPRNSGPSFDGFTPGRGAGGEVPAADDPGAGDSGQSAPHHSDPEQPGLVPPMRVMRRRLNGVYRADGFAGPTRRYILIVALLVALASLPTLAAITAGTATMDEGPTGAMDVPFLPQPSDGPVIRPTAPTSAPSLGPLPGGAADPAGTSPAPPATGPAAPPGADGPSTATPPPARGQAQPQGTAPARPGGASSDGDGEAGRPESGGHDRPRPPASGPGTPSRPAEPRPGKPRPPVVEPKPPSRPKPPSKPKPPADRPGRPGWCHERGACWVKPAHHQRPGRTPHRHCDESAHRSEPRYQHHRQWREERGMFDHQHRSARHREHSAQHRHRSHDGARNHRWSGHSGRWSGQTGNAHRSHSYERRELRVADRTPNSYRSGTADRTHNSRRIQTAERWDSVTRSASWPYRGSHRSDRGHQTDNNDRPAGRHSHDQHRSESGRHHHRGHYGDHNGQR